MIGEVDIILTKGSSKGVREFIQTDKFYNFINSNPNINFEFYLKRGYHPFIRAVYANGLTKDVNLRNYTNEDVFVELDKTNQSSIL